MWCIFIIHLPCWYFYSSYVFTCLCINIINYLLFRIGSRTKNRYIFDFWCFVNVWWIYVFFVCIISGYCWYSYGDLVGSGNLILRWYLLSTSYKLTDLFPFKGVRYVVIVCMLVLLGIVFNLAWFLSFFFLSEFIYCFICACK